ncbi:MULTISPECIES: hypothetical protein [Acidocella]|nr:MULTISPECIES: hypothetical protein [Acidocella]EKN00011.1 hypothetical protein MXAZACID_07396 [Acidocella sp. MX-AZ02]
MNLTACPDAFEAYYASTCDATALQAASGFPANQVPAVTWHVVPLSPSATELVLVLLTILLATLLVSKPEK